jgi:molybdenum cofactor guanylyltransferase
MTSAIVLAGGRGERMGGPKASMPFLESTLLEHAVGLVTQAGCAPVVVAVRSDTPVPALPADVTVVVDPPGDEGPLAALERALEESPQGLDTVVLACDLPNVGPVVARLLAVDPGVAAVARDDHGRWQPMCCRVPRDAALVVVSAALRAGQRRMAALVEGLEPVAVDATDDELVNLNAPEDLATLRRARREV